MMVALDASALLAWLHDEPGAQRVDRLLRDSRMSTVNWVEVIQRASARGLPVESLHKDLDAVGVRLVPFDTTMAGIAGVLHARTRAAGLSLADRACLAMAQAMGLTAITTDRAWSAIDLDISVEVIR